MELKLSLVVVLLAVATAGEAANIFDIGSWSLARYSHNSSLASIGDIIEEDNEMMLDSEPSRRQLATRGKYISYGALKRNAIPCRSRGGSYYNCGQNNQQANTYRRGCSAITKCARTNKP